jgi:hypothetical protein
LIPRADAHVYNPVAHSLPDWQADRLATARLAFALRKNNGKFPVIEKIQP